MAQLHHLADTPCRGPASVQFLRAPEPALQLWHQATMARGCALTRNSIRSIRWVGSSRSGLFIDRLLIHTWLLGTWSKKRDRSMRRQRAHDNFDQHSLSPSPCHVSVDYKGAWTQEWMFLNTTYQDFQPKLSSNDILDIDPLGVKPAFVSLELYLGPSSRPSTSLGLDGIGSQDQPYVPRDADHGLWSETGEAMASLVVSDSSLYQPRMIRSPSPFALGNNEAFLLDYFTNGLAPQCTTWPAENPFVRTIVPICISALNEPLFNTIMAVACHQLSLLNDRRFERDIWVYRGKALHGFQCEIARFRSQAHSPVGWEQVAATLVMLTFFDVCFLPPW